MSESGIIFVEPFYGGSHRALIEVLTTNLTNYKLISLKAKKWHWRARCGTLMLYEKIPEITSETVLFCSSVLNLTELLGLRPDLHALQKIVYFHENQLIYPVQDIKSRDVQYSYNQIMTCLVADLVLFNSHFNRNSFLDNIKKIVKLLPDYRPKNLREKIEKKSKVLYFPMRFPKEIENNRNNSCLHIVWPHRWEYDKGPDEFFNVLFKLKGENYHFKLSILGETFTDNPDIFMKARELLTDEIINFGYVENKSDYYQVLTTAHVVVSTAKHEFFGVSILEAVYCGCYPIVPNALVYPEIYPEECLFSGDKDLLHRLKRFSLDPQSAVEGRNRIHAGIDFDKYSESSIISNFLTIINKK